MTTNKILSLDHVSAGYNGKAKIMDICLDIHEHDFLLVTGHNGSGKTTMIRTMMGLIKPMEGRVLMWQNNVPVRNLNIGYLPQYNNIDKQFPISAFDTVMGGLTQCRRLWGGCNHNDRQQVMETMRQMGVDNLANLHIGQLSGGQLQRVLLSRALVANPQLIVLDEPSTYMDNTAETQMMELLNNMRQQSTVVMVTHNPIVNHMQYNMRRIRVENGRITS